MGEGFKKIRMLAGTVNAKYKLCKKHLVRGGRAGTSHLIKKSQGKSLKGQQIGISRGTTKVQTFIFNLEQSRKDLARMFMKQNIL